MDFFEIIGLYFGKHLLSKNFAPYGFETVQNGYGFERGRA